jgi:hypothetical protein
MSRERHQPSTQRNLRALLPVRFNTLPDSTQLSPNEERARIYAVKGYLRARDGQYDGARDQFVHAIKLDPCLDLTSIPHFWALPRGAHNAAVAALEVVDRHREAARLAAIIERRFRPRAIPARPPRVPAQ